MKLVRRGASLGLLFVALAVCQASPARKQAPPANCAQATSEEMAAWVAWFEYEARTADDPAVKEGNLIAARDSAAHSSPPLSEASLKSFESITRTSPVPPSREKLLQRLLTRARARLALCVAEATPAK